MYITNAVKHFKWERGETSRRRIHRKPNGTEIRACRPWLDQELALVKPRVVVCLGATAAQAMLGRSFRVTKSRGRKQSAPFAEAVFATVHPSAVLRAPDADARAEARKALIGDLGKVAKYLGVRDREVPRTASRGD